MIEVAKYHFQHHKNATECHITSDGNVFHRDVDARNHAKGVKNKTVTIEKFTRAQVDAHFAISDKQKPAKGTDDAGKKPPVTTVELPKNETKTKATVKKADAKPAAQTDLEKALGGKTAAEVVADDNGKGTTLGKAKEGAAE